MNNKTQCEICMKEIENGHRDNIRPGYGANVQPFVATHTNKAKPMCEGHRIDARPLPDHLGK